MTRVDVLLVADGASPHTRRLAAALRDRGLAVELATFEPADLTGVAEHRLGRRPASDDRRYATAIPVLARLLARRRPRVVHAHYVSSFGVLAAFAASLVPWAVGRLVQTAWGTDLLVTARASRTRALLAAFALRRARVVTGDSADLLDAAARLAPRTPRLRFVFGPATELLEAERHPERIVVSARALIPTMRVPLIADGFARARSLDPVGMEGWRLVVAGDGAERAAVASHGDRAIEVAGQLPGDRLHRLLLGAHAVVSIPRSDATSATLLEALAAGAIPIVNDLPANREWVDEIVGVIVPRDPSVDDVAGAIRQVTRMSVPAATLRDRVRAATFDREVDRLVAAYAL